MTFTILAGTWLFLALLVSPPAGRFLWKLPPGTQVFTFLAASLGLVTLPLAATLDVLARALPGAGTGSSLARCSKLILAVLSRPAAAPEVTFSLAFLLAGLFAVLVGFRRAFRSQDCARAMIKGVRGGTLVAPSAQLFAFTAGFVRPRIVVSRGLIQTLEPGCLEVVLAHERAHARGRHPLLILVTQAFAQGLGLAPLRWAADGMKLALEAVADDQAVRSTQDRRLVARTVAEVSLATMQPALGFEGHEVRRVQRLLTPPAPRLALAGLVVAAGLTIIATFAAGHTVHCARLSFAAMKVEQCDLR